MRFRILGWIIVFAAVLNVAATTSPLHAQGTDAYMEKEDMKPAKKEFSPYANRDRYPTHVYFGDTHLHTALSMDAGTFGNRLGLDEAYRFTRGEVVTSSSGYKARLGRPLDFVVIADHSDGMGFFSMFAEGDPAIMDKEEGRRWNKAINEGGQAVGRRGPRDHHPLLAGQVPLGDQRPRADRSRCGHGTIEAAEKYNEPGKFTAFIGYEWTSLVKGNNLHRVVVYRDGADKASRTLPFTLADSADPEELWKALAALRGDDRRPGPGHPAQRQSLATVSCSTR